MRCDRQKLRERNEGYSKHHRQNTTDPRRAPSSPQHSIAKDHQRARRDNPKNRMTHDQSWKWQSETSVNSRVDEEKLMPCYLGRALKRIINWCVAARRRFPGKRILATKLDMKAAFQRCHINASMAVQTCTQLPELRLARMMLRLSFGGALAHRNGE